MIIIAYPTRDSQTVNYNVVAASSAFFFSAGATSGTTTSIGVASSEAVNFEVGVVSSAIVFSVVFDVVVVITVRLNS